jgi:Na+-translocating ferredoxin:NAD+ oxidoreductase subunit C
MFEHFFNTFKGGIKLKENKITSNNSLSRLDLPKQLIVPLKQHIGKETKAIVKIGDFVKKYQLIGDLDENCVYSKVHSPTSGIVKDIIKKEFSRWGEINCVVIETDGKDESIELEKQNLEKINLEKLIVLIKNAGITGLGGAGFPTHIKFDVKDKKINHILINGCECEPYITSDHRIMLEYSIELIKTLKILLKITKIKSAIIGIEDNKIDAIKKLSEIILKEKLSKKIIIKKLNSKYPQGAEKMLAYSVANVIIHEQELPVNEHLIIINVSTLKSIHDAIFNKIPLIERTITVTGDVKKPNNFIVKIGTPISFLIEKCGGFNNENDKNILMGGPMMGILVDKNDPVIKENNCITIIDKKVITKENSCMKCGKCINVCPMQLVPSKLALLSKKEMYENTKNLFVLDCFECGSCTYVCPSKIDLLKHIKKAKSEIIKLNKKD